MIDRSSVSTTPAKLYAFHLRLRPISEGTLMPFSGELVHAAWLDWLRTATPDVSDWLHEKNKRRFFTCSSLQWPFSPARMLEAERNNTHMPLTPEKTYTIRITLLLGELFPLFYNALTDFKLVSSGKSKPPFMRLGKQFLLLEEVVLEDDETSRWTGFTSFAEIIEHVQARKLGRVEPLIFEFASLTTFNRGNANGKEYGNFNALLPLPYYIFPYLAKRWQELAPSELAHLVQREAIEQYIQDEGVIIADYDLKPHYVRFTTHRQPGFIGSCKYHLRGPDDPPNGESPLTVRQQILLLGQLAFYSGAGYKTAMGMGRTRTVQER